MVGVGFLLAFSTALRFGGPRTKVAIRVFNKWVLNPPMLTVAGRHHWYAAALHHTGRTTGRDYATPVVAVPVEGGYVIPLPYGEDVDWLKNVLAKGGATLVFDGATHELVSPEVIDASAALPLLDPQHRRVWQRYRIEHFVRLTSSAT
jgi:deazaflavin-dependent oxidoreductase (nitroreductase family)